ncbi:ATP-binding protein [Streptomyces sp. NPDC095613]|uniref:ATP-binding protein n=1 Tax=Streptomyces sp. NPDC095613 TaxID=3155540 RepID=UPI00331A5B7C
MRTDGQHIPEGETLLAEAVFAREPQSVRSARRWAREVYAGQGADPGLCDTCELLVGEVAANAVVHAVGDAFRVRVLGSLTVEVWDEAYVVPRRRMAAPDSESGRGLELVHALADGYQVRLGRYGKAVCFRPAGAW